MRARPIVIISVVLIFLIFVVWHFLSGKRAVETRTATPSSAAGTSRATPTASSSPNSAATNVYAHNLMLRKGPGFRVYVRWLRGQMTRAHRNVNPSFDDPDSFFLDIQNGVLRTNIGDLSNFLNGGGMANSPLTNLKLSGDGNQIKLNGTLHKVVPLPIELIGNISVASGNRIQIHVTKLSVLKIPFKGLMSGFHISISDLFHPQDLQGIQVSGNDVFLDTTKLLPPPHIRGQLTTVHIVNPDIEEIYGNVTKDITRTEQWRNFIRLSDGTIDFGKLTMHHVDIIMVDISSDAWFDIDLTNYQTQLVNGYTRMTPEAGMQIFMPDLSQIPHNKANQNISMEWLKNRNIAPPADVTGK